MDEKQVAVEMYQKGYRYIIHTGSQDPITDPLYAKTLSDIGPLLRALFPGHSHVPIQSIENYLK